MYPLVDIIGYMSKEHQEFLVKCNKANTDTTKCFDATCITNGLAKLNDGLAEKICKRMEKVDKLLGDSMAPILAVIEKAEKKADQQAGQMGGSGQAMASVSASGMAAGKTRLLSASASLTVNANVPDVTALANAAVAAGLNTAAATSAALTGAANAALAGTAALASNTAAAVAAGLTGSVSVNASANASGAAAATASAGGKTTASAAMTSAQKNVSKIGSDANKKTEDLAKVGGSRNRDLTIFIGAAQQFSAGRMKIFTATNEQISI